MPPIEETEFELSKVTELQTRIFNVAQDMGISPDQLFFMLACISSNLAELLGIDPRSVKMQRAERMLDS